ncbi:MAG: amidohydrolase family protein [Proteobacteria bacterium]|nr:amidohydrolase family protein [Pseudomonadota bacterium]
MAERICIKGGQVFFPENKSIRKKDILISNGKILRIDDEIQVDRSVSIVDATNKLVTPGLVDFHMHAFRYGHLLGIDTEELSPRSGTTTFVDGGSTGSLNFLAFREYVIKPSKSNILAFLNVSAIGQGTDGIQGLHFRENDDERLLHIPSASEVIEKNRDIIVGIKARAYTGLKSTKAMEKARELADLVNLPIMVHLAPPPPEFSEILPYLKKGDIITHPYHGGKQTILNEKGKVRREFWEARQRGIEVDVGLDRFHGNLAVMKSALEQGFSPNYISTDLAMPNLHHIVYDLPTTVSKFVALGIPLVEALEKCTYAPAVKMGKGKEIGCIQEGGIADIAIFEVVADDHFFEDYFDNKIKSKERILPFMTMRTGEILEPNTRTTETLDCVFKGKSPWHFDNE